MSAPVTRGVGGHPVGPRLPEPLPGRPDSYRVAAAQVGPVAPEEDRTAVVARLVSLLDAAAQAGARLVVFPEITLTRFFPRFDLDGDRLDAFYETEMPNEATAPLYERAAELGIAFSLGFAESAVDDGGVRHRFNTAVLVDGDVEVGRYRKIHLPGHAEVEDWRPFQHLEKKYFEVGDLGFGVFALHGVRVGMAICNDRRWPETWRSFGLAGAELVCIGYNTPLHNPPAPGHDRLSYHHNRLVAQAGAYQNALGAVMVAKAGTEDGVHQIGGSLVVSAGGEVLVESTTLGDEVLVADIDLVERDTYRNTTFAFERHRQPDQYGIITETGS